MDLKKARIYMLLGIKHFDLFFTQISELKYLED